MTFESVSAMPLAAVFALPVMAYYAGILSIAVALQLVFILIGRKWLPVEEGDYYGGIFGFTLGAVAGYLLLEMIP